MYRNFSSIYRRLYGYTAAYDSGDSWDSWYRPRWYYNYTRPDYTSNWELWDPLRWVEDVESTPAPTPVATPAPQPRTGSTPAPAGTPEPQPEGTPEPQPAGTPEPQPAGTPAPQPAGTPAPQPAGTPEPEPAGVFETQPGSTAEPQPAGTPEPQPAGTPEPQPAEVSETQPDSTEEPQPASGSPRPASGSPRPASGSRQPASESPRPEIVSPRPPSGSRRPASGSPRPASGSRRPASGSPLPVSGSPRPTSGLARPASARPIKPAEPTEILGVDLLTEDNRGSHRTAAYAKPGLIVRRGQEFDVEMKINKPWTNDDTIRVQLSIGKNPHLNYGTLLLISPGNENDPKQASVVTKDIDNSDGDSSVRLSINLACDSPVGQYTVVFIVRKREDEGRKFTKFLLQEKITVLFNPWCKDDDVYIDNEDEREEYVMNESGRIYTSSSLWHKGKPWTFGQFQESVLDAALYLLEISKLPTQAWANPVRVTRQLSAMVNSNDESGVLSGNWSGDYSDGTSPTSWSGSVKILQQYMDTKTPVKWGQCWVFSGVLTTVCRALGLPTRSVTNFESAHDADESMTIDTFYDEDGNPLKYLNDSVWNFHVWNEGWFRRPDLPGDYGGWQAFDATPQERSEYIFQCGPAPLKAIKQGNVHLGYDARFIFAEVNGDQITWTKLRDGTLKPTERITGEVGKYISTKDVLKQERSIITHLYKHKEGSDEEREAVARAIELSVRRRNLDDFYDLDRNNDVAMTFKPEMVDDGTAKFLFTARNEAAETRTLLCRFTAMATYYTGVTATELDKAKTRMVIEAGQESEFAWKMTAAEWINKAAEDATVGIYAYVRVKETGQRFAKKTVLELNKPELELTFDKTTISRGDESVLTVTFTNPLDVKLTKCSLTIEATGFKPTKQHLSDVGAADVVTASVTMTSLMTGSHDVNATFHSRQLVNISGSTTITVTE